MSNIQIDFSRIVGAVKPMHAVNNGPVVASAVEQTRGNFPAYQAARIPYARTHDAAFYWHHCVDIIDIFPDFRNSPYDEDSYDFALTDDYLSNIMAAGTEVFFRFGSKIEHERRKYGTKVPADFHKFAVVCEHIIRHYNEGWANGFHHGIVYWEIWNEPDGRKSDGDQPNWSGTAEEFYEMYEITARHLKQRFPHIKVGGPAMSYVGQPWFDHFLDYLVRDGGRVPLDFFSWHSYPNDPYWVANRAQYVRERLDAHGYTETESILNEYNYLLNFTDRFIDSILGMIGIRGAAFTAAAMSVGQASSVDMMMYYDARPCAMNGMFDFYTLRVLKGYYPFLYFSDLYTLGNCVTATSDDPDLFVTAAHGEEGDAFLLTYYQQEGVAPAARDVTIHTGKPGTWHIAVTDEGRDNAQTDLPTADGTLTFRMEPNTFLMARKA